MTRRIVLKVIITDAITRTIVTTRLNVSDEAIIFVNLSIAILF